MQIQEKHRNPITKSSIKFSISTKFECLDFQKWKKKKSIERRPTSTKHQGVSLRERNSIHTWYEDTDSNTLTRFEECNSSMEICVLDEGWFFGGNGRCLE